MTHHMSHEEYVAGEKAHVVEIAIRMLTGQTGIIEGARHLTKIQPQVTDQDLDPDFIIFVVIASETENLPIGPEREYWVTSALTEKDKKIQHAEELYREQALASCQLLIERFKAI